MNTAELGQILEEGARSLDITPTMFQEATEHYKAVGDFLENNGIEAEIYPFGSILTGTVVRPYSKDDDAYFDIDIAAYFPNKNPATSSPESVRDSVDSTLLESARYKDMTIVDNQCTTLEYSLDGSRGGFKLDINVCAPCQWIASDDNERELNQDYGVTSMAWLNPPQWHTSNPRGLCNWFLDLNKRFAAINKAERKERLFNANRALFASVEDIPDTLDRSTMQRSVQVLKRCRDEFYSRCDCAHLAPASCILTVLVGQLSKNLADSSSVIDFLESFVNNAGAVARERHLKNPVFNENLLQDWTDDHYLYFTLWINELDSIFTDFQGNNRSRCSAATEALFGSKVGSKVFSSLNPPSVTETTRQVVPVQPWRV